MPSTDLIRCSHRLVLPCLATLAIGLALPAGSLASQGGPQTQEHGVRTEERAARAEERAHEREVREREREARRTAREEEHEARRNARGSGAASGEASGTTGPTGTASPTPGVQPSGRTPRDCHVSVQASSDQVLAGESVTVSGALQCPTTVQPTATADLPVTLYQHSSGAGAHSASAAATATTQMDGSFELNSGALYTNTALQVQIGDRRARVIVKVAPLVTLAASPSQSAQTSAAGTRARAQTRTRETFTGTVNPIAAGAPVVLQVSYGASSEQWRFAGFGRVTADGSFSIEHAFRIPGPASVRAIVHVGKHNLAGVSAPIVYEAAQSQNPQLTIQDSADPLSYGQQVTISGVAAGAANQPVTLLARTPGGSFAAVATVTTEASGAYSFTEEPLQNTYYQVSDATTKSTALLEGVAFALTPAGAPSTVQVGEQLTFSGTVAPASEGQVVDLERGDASGAGFRTIATATVNASAQYEIPYTFDRAGAYVLRVKVPGTGRLRSTAAAPFTVTATG